MSGLEVMGWVVAGGLVLFFAGAGLATASYRLSNRWRRHSLAVRLRKQA